MTRKTIQHKVQYYTADLRNQNQIKCRKGNCKKHLREFNLNFTQSKSAPSIDNYIEKELNAEV